MSEIVAGELLTSDGTVISIGAVDRIPNYDKRSGAHLWVTLGMWRVNPERLLAGESAELDTENLLHIGGIGCYYCELGYDARTASRQCTGMK